MKLLAMVMVRGITPDDEAGLPTLHGVHEALVTDSYPFVVSRAVIWTNVGYDEADAGLHSIALSIWDEATGIQVGRIAESRLDVPVSIERPQAAHQFVISPQNLRLEHPGFYEFRLAIDGRAVRSLYLEATLG
jgi:hypothetical protein